MAKKKVSQKEKTNVSLQIEKSWALLLTKLGIVFLVVISVIHYTDYKAYFEDQSHEYKNRVYKRWNAFYDFSKRDSIDILLVGNSHIYQGIEPAALSTTLGVNSFILASPGESIKDTYFSLREALKNCNPKVVIIETFGITHVPSENTELTSMLPFNARKDVVEKLYSMPYLFSVDNYIPAWSSTIRNHDFIFSSEKPLEAKPSVKQMREQGLYLGRYIRNEYLTDSTLRLYDSLGAPFDGKQAIINESSDLYVQKIVTLCEKHNTTPIFVTLPMYYKHICNYEDLRQRISSIIAPTSAIWLDLQMPYDTVKFNFMCFENTYEKNQHISSHGAFVCANKIAHFIHDSLRITFPDRSLNKRWKTRYYKHFKETGFIQNYRPSSNDKAITMICTDTIVNSLSIKECFIYTKEKQRILFLKIAKDSSFQVLNDTIKAIFWIEHQNKKLYLQMDLLKNIEYEPFNFYLYGNTFISDCKFLELKGITNKR